MRNEVLETVIRELEFFGIRPTVFKSDHPKVTWAANGHTRTLVIGNTPSDIRARYNARAQVRRWLKEDGVQQTAPAQPSDKVAKAFTPGEKAPTLQERIMRLEEEVAALVEVLLDQTPPSMDIGLTINGVSVNLQAPPRPPEPQGRVTLYDRILNEMPFDGAISPQELSKKVGKSNHLISRYLQELKGRGKVENLLRGQWRKKRSLNGHG